MLMPGERLVWQYFAIFDNYGTFVLFSIHPSKVNPQGGVIRLKS